MYGYQTFMSRTLKTDIPGTDWRVDFDELVRRGPCALFGAGPPPKLVLDVGFGRGEFLHALAEKDAGVGFLGIEYSRKRVLKMARRLARTELGNVRLVHAPAQAVFERAIPAASVHRCWINFPDPWPKKRHASRRLVQPAFIREVARALETEGLLDQPCLDCAELELPVGTDWLMTPPVVIAIEDGVVKCAKEADDSEAPECLLWH